MRTIPLFILSENPRRKKLKDLNSNQKRIQNLTRKHSEPSCGRPGDQSLAVQAQICAMVGRPLAVQGWNLCTRRSTRWSTDCHLPVLLPLGCRSLRAFLSLCTSVHGRSTGPHLQPCSVFLGMLLNSKI